MKKNKLIWYICCYALFCYACKDFAQVVEIDLPEHQSRLAVTALLTNDDFRLDVFLSNSIGILEDRDTIPPIPQSEMQLFKDGQLLANNFDTITGTHVSYIDIPRSGALSDGSNYRLEISTPGFEAVHGEQPMPKLVPIKNVEIELNGTLNFEGQRVDEISIEFQDPIEEENYYGIALDKYSYLISSENDTFFYNNGGFSSIFELASHNPSVDQLSYNSPFHLIVSDASFNGQTATVNMHTIADLKDYKGIVTLFNLNRDTYLYYRSIKQQENTLDNPFAEPVTIHSNIENGYGIFGLSAVSHFLVE